MTPHPRRRAAIVTVSPQPAAISVDAEGAAHLVGISPSLWFKMMSQGKVPSPVKLGRRSVWLVAELHAWMSAGAPEIGRWTLQRERFIRNGWHTGGAPMHPGTPPDAHTA